MPKITDIPNDYPANIKSEIGAFVLCPPIIEYYQVEDINENNLRGMPQKELAPFQHNRLKSIIQESGFFSFEVMELPAHPHSVFARDALLSTPFGIIKLRMGNKRRAGEEDWMFRSLYRYNLPIIGQIKSPGTVEGGDIVLAGNTAFIGISQRTNKEGAKQLESILFPLGYEIKMLKVPKKKLHLSGALSFIGEGWLLALANSFEKREFEGFFLIETPSKKLSAANILALPNGVILADIGNTETIKILVDIGFQVRALDLSEFIKESGEPFNLALPIYLKK